MIRRHQVMGRDGMTLSIIAAIAMSAVAFFVGSPTQIAGNMGICFPSPNVWPLTPVAGWAVNLGILAVVTITLYLCNKEFSFVQGNDTVLTGMFLIMASSNTWLSGTLTSSGIMAFANLICLIILFGCYRKRNATQELFVIATILSLGSMIQYAFVFMLPVYIIGAMMLKCFSFKGFMAMLMGLFAPYWIGIGFGLIPLDSFSVPEFANLFAADVPRSELFIMLINVAVTFVLGLFLALNNIVKLYAGNTQRYKYNMVINLLGVASLICIIVDYNNLFVYIDTLYVISAVQLANLFALWDINRGSLWLMALTALYMVGFMLML